MSDQTIAYWITTFGYRLLLWHAATSKSGRAYLYVWCVGDESEHEFYF